MTLRVQRLLLIFLTIVIIFSAVLLILYNTRENVSFFYTPSEISKADMKTDKIIRIGGFVENKSFNKISSSFFKFRITDEKASILVTYNGILPDLFGEGQGAVIEGFFDNSNIFNATEVFAKHDENYVPATIKEDLKETGYWNKKYK